VSERNWIKGMFLLRKALSFRRLHRELNPLKSNLHAKQENGSFPAEKGNYLDMIRILC
jgi:hypothetical protein